MMLLPCIVMDVLNSILGCDVSKRKASCNLCMRAAALQRRFYASFASCVVVVVVLVLPYSNTQCPHLDFSYMPRLHYLFPLVVFSFYSVHLLFKNVFPHICYYFVPVSFTFSKLNVIAYYLLVIVVMLRGYG